MNLIPVPVEVPAEILDLLRRVAGPAADEIGLGLRDSLRMVRAELQLRFLQRWRRKLAEANIQPQAVKMSLLFDILAGASLEEDDDLQNLWANLLANAADPNHECLITTAFPNILRQISKEEAVYVNEMFDIRQKTSGWTWRTVPSYEMNPDYEEPNARLDPVYYDNLKRLGLIEATEEMIPVVAITSSEQEAKQLTSKHKPLTEEYYFLTSLGAAFVQACRTPKGKAQSLGTISK
jgi:Abortive infection alpha